MHDTPLPPSFTNNLYSHPVIAWTVDVCTKNAYNIGRFQNRIKRRQNKKEDIV